MSEAAGAVRNGLVLRFSVPATGELRTLATELAVRVAVQLGANAQDNVGIARTIDDLARSVVPSGNGASTADIAFEFYKNGRELKIEARSDGRASEARIPLPA
jgi:hypothetical protein